MQTELSESAEIYKKEIARHPTLDREGEVRLVERAAEGDPDARNRLVEGHLRFAYKIAREYRTSGVPLDDLVGAANAGLLRAAETFDVTKGFRFISYAVWWIRRYIRDTLLIQGRLIRLPANRVRDLQTIQNIVRTRESYGQSDPSVQDLAAETGIAPAFVTRALQDTPAVSLYARVGNADQGCLIDLIADKSLPEPDSSMMEESRNRDIKESLDLLDPRERTVIELHFGLSGQPAMTLTAIGERMKVSKERVRQIREAALGRLRRAGFAPRLQAYRDL